MSKTRHTAAEPLGAALEKLVDGLGIKKKLHEYDAVVYWENAVGTQIAKMTNATRVTQGTLFVQVKTSTWRNELTLRKKEIITKLNTFIGSEIVKDIKFQ